MKKSLAFTVLKKSFSSGHCKWRSFATEPLVNQLNTTSELSKCWQLPFNIKSPWYVSRFKSQFSSSFFSKNFIHQRDIYKFQHNDKKFFTSSAEVSSDQCSRKAQRMLGISLQNKRIILAHPACSLQCLANPRYIYSRSFHSSGNLFKFDPESPALGFKVEPNQKIIETTQKLKGAKDKLETAKHHLMGDLQDTKSRMKEKVDEIIERENIFTIPNLLCVSRLVAAPFLCHLVVSGNYTVAMGLFLFAGFTDLADGWIARTFPSQASKLGSFLDPLADKVLVAVLFLSLTYNGLIPFALTGLIVYRDVAIIAAASWVRYQSLPAPRTLFRYFDATHATVELAPTLLSKVNTAVQLFLITATMAQPIFDVPSASAMTALWFITTCTTVASGAGYIFSNNTYRMLGDLQRQHQEEEEQQKKDKSENEIGQEINAGNRAELDEHDRTLKK